MKKRVIALLLTAILVMGALVACGTKDNAVTGTSESKKDDKTATSRIEQIKKDGKIRIGVFSDKSPFGYVDANGDNQGFDVYIAKRFAKDLIGDENAVEFVLVEAASRVEYLTTGKVDIILANFTVTDERAEVVDFANPYMVCALGVVSPDGAPITSADEFAGKTLIVNKGTTAEIYLRENYPDVELLAFDENTEAFNALKDGRGDALVHDNTLLFAWALENAGFTVGIEAMGNQDTIAPAVKKGDTELLEWINKELESLGKENFIHEAYDATLKPVYGDTVNPESVVVEGGVVNN